MSDATGTIVSRHAKAMAWIAADIKAVAAHQSLRQQGLGNNDEEPTVSRIPADPTHRGEAS